MASDGQLVLRVLCRLPFGKLDTWQPEKGRTTKRFKGAKRYEPSVQNNYWLQSSRIQKLWGEALTHAATPASRAPVQHNEQLEFWATTVLQNRPRQIIIPTPTPAKPG